MNTAAAADVARVTVATIRTWCRRGVIAAEKVGGRWVIEETSLLHRIALGGKEPAVTTIESVYRRLAATLAGALAHPAAQEAIASGRVRRAPAVEAPACEGRAPRTWLTHHQGLLDEQVVQRDMPGAGPLSKACREWKLWSLDLERHGRAREDYARYINEALTAYEEVTR